MGVATYEPHPIMQQQCRMVQWPLKIAQTLRFSSTVDVSCWKCNRDVALSSTEVTLTCPCEEKVLLPLQIKNYFNIMNCKRSFEVDVKLIRQRYHKLQVLFHPDRYTRRPEEEQQIALDSSGIVNKAYNTLINPYGRGLYLLQLSGITIDEKDNMSSDIDFLEEMMILNEEVNSCNDQERLQELNEEIEGNISRFVTDISQSFDNGDLFSAKNGLARLKYYVNLKQELQNKLTIS